MGQEDLDIESFWPVASRGRPAWVEALYNAGCPVANSPVLDSHIII
jgi:hypothetical protein